jgi:hypothetical protein
VFKLNEYKTLKGDRKTIFNSMSIRKKEKYVNLSNIWVDRLNREKYFWLLSNIKLKI